MLLLLILKNRKIRKIRKILADGLSTLTLPIKGKPVFSNGSRSLLRNPSDCTILESWVFENFILADESFAKALQIFETGVSVNNNLCEKLVSSSESPIALGEIFKVTWVSFFYFWL